MCSKLWNLAKLDNTVIVNACSTDTSAVLKYYYIKYVILCKNKHFSKYL